jgi:uncharacterized protein (TIGR00369 family)
MTEASQTPGGDDSPFAQFIGLDPGAQTGGPNEGKFMSGIDLHATFLSNQLGGTVTATARVVRAGRRVTVIRTQVTGDGDKLLLELTTTHSPT